MCRHQICKYLKPIYIPGDSMDLLWAIAEKANQGRSQRSWLFTVVYIGAVVKATKPSAKLENWWGGAGANQISLGELRLRS